MICADNSGPRKEMSVSSVSSLCKWGLFEVRKSVWTLCPTKVRVQFDRRYPMLRARVEETWYVPLSNSQ